MTKKTIGRQKQDVKKPNPKSPKTATTSLPSTPSPITSIPSTGPLHSVAESPPLSGEDSLGDSLMIMGVAMERAVKEKSHQGEEEVGAAAAAAATEVVEKEGEQKEDKDHQEKRESKRELSLLQSVQEAQQNPDFLQRRRVAAAVMRIQRDAELAEAEATRQLQLKQHHHQHNQHPPSNHPANPTILSANDHRYLLGMHYLPPVMHDPTTLNRYRFQVAAPELYHLITLYLSINIFIYIYDSLLGFPLISFFVFVVVVKILYMISKKNCL
uniref:Uncharacterized protein n=1 Tax=Physcomitrium patens TaxID=3218 RepID=A0A7I3Z6G1_PHYPA